jgi:hypothetical protein
MFVLFTKSPFLREFPRRKYVIDIQRVERGQLLRFASLWLGEPQLPRNHLTPSSRGCSQVHHGLYIAFSEKVVPSIIDFDEFEC